MFSVKVREEDALIKFGPLLTCTTTRIEDAERIRAYLKEQKEWIRQQGTTATSRDMLSRMWWTLQKMVDYGFWSIQDQRYIVYWHDTCADQFTTP
jgi:hypothetical protein